MHAIAASHAGGPDVLEYLDVPDPVPGPLDLLVRVEAAGVNFIDTYQRSGTYPVEYPFFPGFEGAGTVTGVGADVTGFATGDRVMWMDGTRSYAQLAAVPAAICLAIPDEVTSLDACALGMQGFTAHYLSHSTYPVGAGETVLVHAGAGGVGLLLTQMIVARGGHVISTVSTAAKEELSRDAGAEHVIRYTEFTDMTTQLPRAVRELTGGEGVAAVYDSVGKTTFDGSLASLRRRGMLVLFGGSSGQVPPFDLQRLNRAGSLFVTRPTLGDYTATREELLWRGREVFGALAAATLRVRIGATYPLAEASRAHQALESRSTTGKVLLLPEPAAA